MEDIAMRGTKKQQVESTAECIWQASFSATLRQKSSL